MIALLYSAIHLLLGALAVVWTFRRLKRAGYTDGCFVYGVSFGAFVFAPLALAVLIVDWAIGFALGEG